MVEKGWYSDYKLVFRPLPKRDPNDSVGDIMLKQGPIALKMGAHVVANFLYAAPEFLALNYLSAHGAPSSLATALLTASTVYFGARGMGYLFRGAIDLLSLVGE